MQQDYFGGAQPQSFGQQGFGNQQQVFGNQQQSFGNQQQQFGNSQFVNQQQQWLANQQQNFAPQRISNPYMHGAIWVQGEAAARAYDVPAGQTYFLVDSDEDVLYVKSTDIYGKPNPLLVYDYYLRENNNTETESNLQEYVKKEDLEELISNAVAQAVEQKMGEMSLKVTTTSKQKATKEG